MFLFMEILIIDFFFLRSGIKKRGRFEFHKRYKTKHGMRFNPLYGIRSLYMGSDHSGVSIRIVVASGHDNLLSSRDFFPYLFVKNASPH